MVAPRLPLKFLAGFGSAGPEGNALGSAEMTSRLCNRGAKETRSENGDMVDHVVGVTKNFSSEIVELVAARR